MHQQLRQPDVSVASSGSARPGFDVEPPPARTGPASSVHFVRLRLARLHLVLFLTVFFLGPASLRAEQILEPVAGDGRVEIPLEVYNRLLEEARDPTRLPRPAPASFALGKVRATVAVSTADSGTTAEVRLELSIDILEDEWVLVPVLPAATAVESATVDGKPVQLLATPTGLAWSTKTSGSHRMSLVYRVDASRSGGGFSLAAPLPRAAAISLVATLPGKNLDVAVIPAAGLRITPAGSGTRIEATVPTSRGVQITWRAPSDQSHALSRASYTGRLSGDAVAWTAQLTVELFTEATILLPLLPQTVTLSDLQVDSKAASILVEGNKFVTPIKGRGIHRVTLGFETPVRRSEGPPGVELQVPAVPVSQFDLVLPGKKEVTVTPAANVTRRLRDGSTLATVFAPMSQRLAFSWAEAVPEEVRAEVRANASLYHAIYAEEGVLDIRAFVLYEITRGETNLLRLTVPPEVQINRVSSPTGAVADWRIEGQGTERTLEVFLDRKIRERLLLELHYDRSLGSSSDLDTLDLPLLSSPDAHRQRGMVALLSNAQLTLDPKGEGGATRVGENQLPPFVRDALSMTVAHTFKYVEEPPLLTVEAKVPTAQKGRFDAQVDTLLSLGEVTLTGSASLEIHVKSGRIGTLALRAPAGIHILHLTAPSLRTHRVSRVGDEQRIDVEFTQEMEGQFRLEVTYEQILGDAASQISVPILAVEGAEVGQGRLALEALTAVEVQPVRSTQLSDLDVADLPQQLVLRTTNPILLAYKYVESDPGYELVLKVTRHNLLDVQQAAIDEAEYRTLFTRDGLAVTTVRFLVRNSSKQFLRIALPAGADVWSAFVDGRAEKPALAEEDGSRRNVLLKIINSTQGFPVQVVYATPGSKIRGLGAVEALLPIPDILVTRSRWDIYLPAEMRYRRPKSNMELVAGASPMDKSQIEHALVRQLEDAAAQMMAPLTLSVPTAGIHFAFEKLYANQANQRTWLEIPYASQGGARVGALVSLLATVVFWVGLLVGFKRAPAERRWALGAALLAALVLAVTLGHLGASATPAGTATLLLALALGVWRWKVSAKEERH